MTVWKDNHPVVWHIHDDGGRKAAGYEGLTGDCAVRSIAIATEIPYQEVYDRMNDFIKGYERKSKRRNSRSSSRTGVYHPTMRAFMERELGWLWTPTMEIGTGCTVHVRSDELPDDRLVLSLSKHYTAFIHGQIRDTHDCSRAGTRCVYGYWRAPEVSAKLPQPVVDQFDISVPGAVYFDALDPNASEMAEAIGLPDPRVKKRGRGRTFFYDGVSKDVAADLADYLFDRGNTLWGSTEPSERYALRACVQTAQAIRKQIEEEK